MIPNEPPVCRPPVDAKAMRHRRLVRLWRDRNGATAVEYGLIVGVVIVGILIALTLLGTKLTGVLGVVVQFLGIN